MEFDIRSSIVTLGPLEPAVILALVVGLLAAWPAGRALGSLTARVADPWRRLVYLGPVWVLVAVLLFVLLHVVAALTFKFMHPEFGESFVCMAVVWPHFLLVPLLTFVVAAFRVRRQAQGVRRANTT